MKLFIGNLPHEITDEKLRETLAEHEPIFEIRRPLDRVTGEPRGFAFVTLGSRSAGEKAIAALDGMKIGGRELRVSEAEERRAPDPAERPGRVSMRVEVERRVDDRPVGADGRKVRYKGI